MKSTEPSGQAVPQAGVTVTVMVVVSPAAKVAGAATSVVVVARVPPVVHPEAGVPVHSCARLYTSIDPSPGAWSYPGPALKPYEPVSQPGLPAAQGTMLFPTVMSWKISVELCASE